MEHSPKQSGKRRLTLSRDGRNWFVLEGKSTSGVWVSSRFSGTAETWLNVACSIEAQPHQKYDTIICSSTDDGYSYFFVNPFLSQDSTSFWLETEEAIELARHIREVVGDRNRLV